MPLGGVRRVEGHPQTPPEPSAQRHQVFLEAQRTRGVGSAGIEGQQDLLRVWIMLGTIFLPRQGDGIAICETAKADLQRLDRGVAASVLFRQRTQVDMKSSCD